MRKFLYNIIYIILVACILLAILGCKSKDVPQLTPDIVPEPEPEPELTIDQICAQTLCRKETKLRLQIDRDNFYTYTFPRTPYYYKDTLVIIPGELIYLELELDEDRIVSSKVVQQPSNPSTTLTLKFEQLHQFDKDAHGMMISVVNPLKYNVNFAARIQTIDSSELVTSDTCTVIAKRNGYTLWENPITQLVISDVYLSSEKPETLSCP